VRTVLGRTMRGMGHPRSGAPACFPCQPWSSTPDELAAAAQACRAMAYQEGERAKRMENPERARSDREGVEALRGAGREVRGRAEAIPASVVAGQLTDFSSPNNNGATMRVPFPENT